MNRLMNEKLTELILQANKISTELKAVRTEHQILENRLAKIECYLVTELEEILKELDRMKS